MYKTNVLIVSGRKELSIKYKKIIEALGQNAFLAGELSEALSIIQYRDIEFIIVSDTVRGNIAEFISKIRILTYNLRPVIIAVSKSSDEKDRIEILENGADDFLGEEISKQEFTTRFQAHLRRYLETSINADTKILEKRFTEKALKKSLLSIASQQEGAKKDALNAYLLIKIDKFNSYRKTHGEIKSAKVLQTLSAIINSTINKDDFVGHIKEYEFLLITNPYTAEKMAQFLTFAFNNIVDKFYSNNEYEDNFVLQTSENKEELKEGLMKLFISVLILNDPDKTKEEVLSNLYDMLKLCKNSKQSTYIVDRVKLKGKTEQKKKKNKVLILEPDIALSYLLKNIFEMEGIKSLIITDRAEFPLVYKEFLPDVVILDWSFGLQEGGGNIKENSKEGGAVAIAKQIALDNTKLIFTSSYLNKKEILKSGADLYMPKPYEVGDILKWVERFLEGDL